MKIDYEVNADEEGYRICIKVDGKKVHEAKHERNEYGTKHASGDKDDHCKDDDIYELLQNFLPFEIFRICKDRTDAE